MKEKIKDILQYGGLTRNEFITVSPNIINNNKSIGTIVSILSLISAGMLFGLSYIISTFEPIRHIYQIAIILSIILLILFFIGKWQFRCVEIATIAARIFLMSFGYVISIYRSDTQSTLFIAMLIIVPWIFIIRPKQLLISVGLWVLIFIISSFKFKTNDIRTLDIIYVIIFGLLSAINSTITTCTKIKGFKTAKQIGMMSTTDKLTGLNNRNCYEWKLDSYPDKCKTSLCCVYIDANGLHELNNTKGHEAGDHMLTTIADVIQETFGEYDSYRTGGDEFIAFAMDVTPKDISDMIKKIKQKTQEKDYHVAIGHDLQKKEHIDIQTMLKTAEKRMYRDKENYYEAKGIEHR